MEGLFRLQALDEDTQILEAFTPGPNTSFFHGLVNDAYGKVSYISSYIILVLFYQV